MSAEQPQNTPDLKQSLGGIIGFVKSVFAIDQIDFNAANENIRKNVTFKGFNVWILITSILICSLGLSLNNTAIIIGAMLISPLMGPINGLGLGIGTFDRALVNKSLKNIGVATVVSILTATIFFRLTPTSGNLSELFSRTQPVILDLFVAFFGGVAGILAASRNINTNVVPGVAIATALMPPLCTAGYGLATWQMEYFLGAFYLFFMNCVMISVAAVILILYLKYPKFSFINDRTKRKVKNGIIASVIIFSVPSIILYYNLLQESKVNRNIEEFVNNEFKTNKSIYVTSFEYNETDSGRIISVSVNGQPLGDAEILSIEQRMSKYGLNDYKLLIYQSARGVQENDLVHIGEKFKVDILADLYERNEEKLKNKEDEIALLRGELRRVKLNNIATDKLVSLAKSQFDIEEIAIDNLVYVKDEGQDTIPTVLVRWSDQLTSNQINSQTQKMTDLFNLQLDRKDVVIIRMN